MELAVRPAQNGHGARRRWTAERKLAWIEHYNQQAPAHRLGDAGPAEFYADWMVKNEQRPVPN